MQIECGTTTEHRVRLGIFLAMCIVFAAYFGYDGVRGYPAKNLEWARQNIQSISREQADKIRTNPKVLMAALADTQQQVARGELLTEADVRAKLGEPAAVVPRSDGDGTDAWYVGPAACARLSFVGGKLSEVKPLQNINKSEGDIWLQKVLGAVLGIVALGMGIHYYRIMTMRTILDDTGLTAKGRKVAWGEMAELDTSDYNRKGWLDVVYRRDGDTGSVRLDSYHVAGFDEIVQAICERKGFACPIKPRGAEPADEDA
jgi:hypothetical protein